MMWEDLLFMLGLLCFGAAIGFVAGAMLAGNDDDYWRFG